MRILYITNSFPYPLTSGYLRHFHLIRELSRRNSITLLSLTNDTFCEQHARALAPYTSQVLTFPRTVSGINTLGNTVTKTRSFMGCERAVCDMREAIDEQIRDQQFDVVLLSGKQTLPAVRNLRRIPIVADVCDATSVRLRGHLAHADLQQAPGLLGRYLRMRKVEQRLMRRAVYLVFASCRDRESLRQDPSQNAAVVPNGIELDYWKRAQPRRDRNRIVFTGVMHYAPNAAAAEHLIREILPRVRKAIPDAELTIVGKNPKSKLLAAAAGVPGVTVTGFVNDVRPYLDRATVFAAPLRFGAGIQNKLLEAMAMGVPVVASPVAADGLRTEDGRLPPIEVAARADAFTQATIRELRLAARRSEPSELLRQYVQEHFSWSEAASTLERILIRAVNRYAQQRSPQNHSTVAAGEPAAVGEL